MQTTTKNTNANDMQLHIDKAYLIIDEYLPEVYIASVRSRLPKNTEVTDRVMYDVRSKRSKNRIDVLNAMVEVALENKKHIESLIENTKKNRLNKSHDNTITNKQSFSRNAMQCYRILSDE